MTEGRRLRLLEWLMSVFPSDEWGRTGWGASGAGGGLGAAACSGPGVAAVDIVVAVGREVFARGGRDALSRVAKLHFRTTELVLGK